jgi:uncharacterized phage protein (TIGR02218 family)
MKTLNSGFQSALDSESRAITRCVKITRGDGVVLGFTEYDRDLVIDGVIYKAAIGFSPTATLSDSDLQVNSVKLSSVLDDGGINQTDLKRGAYDYARALLFIVNPYDLPSSLSTNPPKHLALLGGTVAKASYSEIDYTIEITGLTGFLSGKLTNVTSKTCRYTFGDGRCTKNLATVTESLTIATVSSDGLGFTSFSKPDDKFTGGSITFTSGVLNGLKFAIAKQLGNYYWVSSPFPSLPSVGNTFSAVPNCQKREIDCKNYNNFANFGGEPTLPGLDAYYSLEEQ